MVRVLVVDDSAFMRQALTRLLSAAGDIEVVGSAPDGAQAVERVRTLRPDVVTLDVEMPVMDGLAALRAIMRECPTPVVMISSLTTAHAEITVESLCAGATDFVAKPSGTISLDIERSAAEIVGKVRAAAGAPTARHAAAQPVRSAGGAGRQVLVIGCSTGGPRALAALLPALPADLPAPVVVVQHMPPGFTRPLAERLDRESRLQVREAQDGEALARGVALVAPGGRHLVVGCGRVSLDGGPPRHGVRPAVDVAVDSAVEAYGSGTVVAILTGMGMDGAEGAQRVRRAGGRVLAEARESCVVYGMPRAVVEMGNADRVAPLQALPREIVAALSRREVSIR